MGGTMTLLSYPRNSSGIQSWEFTAGSYPAVFRNSTSNTLVTDFGAGVYPSGSVWCAAGENGTARNFAVIRCTVPTGGDGTYRVQSSVRTGLDGGSSQDADFHVARNGVELFGQSLFPNSGTSYSNELILVEGDTIDFLIGRGPDGHQAGSILKIQATLDRATTNFIAPTFATQPASRSNYLGETATFTAGVSGTPPFGYQWRFNDGDLPGATQSSLVLTNLQLEQAGNYVLLITNSVGSITSSVAVLTVNLPPPPSSTNLVLNGGFESGVTPGGALNLTAPDSTSLSSWSVQTGTIDYIGSLWSAGDGVRSLDMNGVSTGSIRQQVTGFSPGRIYRLSFLMAGNLGAGPTIKAIRASVGTNTQDFTFDITGRSLTQMGWTEKTMEFIPTSVSMMLGFDSLTAGNAGPALDSISILPLVLPPGPPVIRAHPQSVTVLEGNPATFQVSALGEPSPLDYQWLHDTSPLPSATNASLTLSNVSLLDAGPYTVIVANPLGSVTSLVATLTVTQAVPGIRVIGSDAAGGGEVNVPIQIRANGNENALGFSLNFNTTLLTFLEASLGSGTPAGSALLLNTNSVASGRLGLGVGLPANAALDRGTQQVVVIKFLVAPVVNQTSTTISFGDQPTLRQLSDAHAQNLPAAYSSGNVAVSDAQVEGDLSPRPAGNRAMTIVDWVQMGRFVALLDAIGGSNEFQRADCAPRATKGNGIIGASDWVQVGRYAIGLDPLTIIGGPTEPDAGGGGFFSPASSGTTLSLMNCSIAQGQTNVVPVVVGAQGTENAMTFSVMFDPAKLAFVGAVPGAAAGNASLNQNLGQAGSGRIGLALALPPGTSLAVGSREVVQLRFAALATAPASTMVSFTNAPVPREVSDALANPLATTYTPATVSVIPPPGPPMHISRNGNFVFITWPTSGAAAFELEATAGPLGTAWTAVPGVIDLGEQKLAIVAIGGTERYFRLKKP